jgi:hypothetical protein
VGEANTRVGKSSRGLASIAGRPQVRALTAVFVFSAVVLAGPLANTEAAQGNWSPGCAPGWACHWKTNMGSGVATSTTTDDTSFVGDVHWDGTPLGDKVKYIQNRTANWIVPARDPDYFRPYLAIQPAGNRGPYPTTAPDGVSSVNVSACVWCSRRCVR